MEWFIPVLRLVHSPILLAWLVLLALFASGCQRNSTTEAETVQVFAAASLSDALQDLGARFEASTGLAVSYNFAGSNVLARQIAATSLADVFISADSLWMDYLQERERLGTETRIDLLGNRLVVVASANSDWRMGSASDLCQMDFRFLCLGDPDAVPAGRYARTWLSGISCGDVSAWEVVKDRLSPAADVRAALAQVAGQPEAIGFVYATDQHVFEDRVRVLHEVSGVEARYPAAITAKGLDKQAAGRFFLFLQSEEARLVFESYGFLDPTSGSE